MEFDAGAMMDAGIRIDPTNKNLNLKEEIKKLVKKEKIGKIQKTKIGDLSETLTDNSGMQQ